MTLTLLRTLLSRRTLAHLARYLAYELRAR